MAEPYKVYFHWQNDSSGKLKAVSCDEENIPGEEGWLANLSHYTEALLKGKYGPGLRAAGLTVNHANTLHLRKGGFLYMDVGCWLNNKQTFGLICGQDAAVCSFKEDRGQKASGGGKSLLDQFLQLPGVKVVFREKIHSPQPDPQRLCLILPDMHVPDAPPKSLEPADDLNLDGAGSAAWGVDRRAAAAILNLKPFRRRNSAQQAFDELAKRDLFGSRDSIPAMINFLSLVREFGRGHPKQITLVQLGDMYELWAGREPEFEPSTDNKINLLLNGDKKVGEWIGRTHQRWPELFKAFNECDKDKAGIEMLFLHGNHDDYLSCPKVVAAANAYIQALPTQSRPLSTVFDRRPEIDGNRIFIEHGQRCDPYNYDGAIEGFNNANRAAEHPILKKVGSTERAMFVVAASAMWCVKERNFGVYVMGHTHTPDLKRVEVYHQREGTSYATGPKGVRVKVTTETPLEGTE